MPEVTIKLATGGTATVSGSAEEVAQILRLAGFAALSETHERGSGNIPTRAKGRASRKAGPREHVVALKGDGFFKKQRTLNEVQEELKGQGHIYPLGTLSPTVVRLVRDRELGRLKDKSKRWTYVER